MIECVLFCFTSYTCQDTALVLPEIVSLKISTSYHNPTKSKVSSHNKIRSISWRQLHKRGAFQSAVTPLPRMQRMRLKTYRLQR